MQQSIRKTILNKDGQVRWDILIIQVSDDRWEVEEDSKYSLFSSPLAIGKNADDAYDNFIKVEKALIDSL